MYSFRRTSLAAAFFALLLAQTPAWSQDPRALLSSVARNYQDISSYHFGIQIETAYLSELSRSWNKEYLSLAADGKGRYRYESRSSMEWLVVTSDGTKEWVSHPWTNEYTQGLVSASAEPAAPLRGRSPAFASKRLSSEAKHRLKRLAQLHQNIRSLELMDPEVIHVNGQSLRCLVVKVSYDPPAGWTKEKFFEETILWIDPQTMLLRKEHRMERGRLSPNQPRAQTTLDTVTLYDVAELSMQPSEAMFRFTPSPEARLVEEFSPPGVTVNLLGRPAPPLKLKTLAGSELKPDFFQKKVLLVDFWATWCSPCLQQMPIFAKLHADLKDKGLLVVGVNKDEDPKIATAYLDKNKYDWLNLHDQKFEVSQLWGAEGIPTVAIVDRAGKVVFVKYGTGENDEVEIRNALAKADPAFAKK